MENNKRPIPDKELQETFAKLHGEGKNIRYVNLDDEVEFNCNRCGGCCTCRDDILLSPYDVYNLAVALNTTGQDIVNSYLNVYIGQHSHLPVMTIADTPQHKCPFLEFDVTEMLYKCKVDSRKPGPCRTHPFGIVRRMCADTMEPGDVHFIATDFCNNHGTTKTTVREYLGEDYINSLDDRKVSYKLQSFVTKLLNLEKIHAIIEGVDSYEGFTDNEKHFLKHLTENARGMLWNAYVIPYLESVYNFKPDVDFLSQCKKGFKDLIKSSIALTTILTTLQFDVRPKDDETFDNIVKQYLTEEELDILFKDLQKNIEKADAAVMKKIKEMEEEDVNTGGN